MAGSRKFWKQEAFKERGEALWTVYLETRTEASRDDLLEMYMPLCNIVARRVCNGLPMRVDVHDLQTDAGLGLLHAIENWQPHRSAFITYSLKRMRGAIFDGLRDRDPISRWGRMLLNRMMASKKVYMDKHGVEPSVRELARLARLPLKVCLRHVGLCTAEPFVSIQAMTDEEELQSPTDSMSDRLTWMEETDHGKYLRKVMVADFIDWLLELIENPRDRRICQLYLVDGVIQRDIARREGLSEARISLVLKECRTVWLKESEWLRTEKEARDGK